MITIHVIYLQANYVLKPYLCLFYEASIFMTKYTVKFGWAEIVDMKLLDYGAQYMSCVYLYIFSHSTVAIA